MPVLNGFCGRSKERAHTAAARLSLAIFWLALFDRPPLTLLSDGDGSPFLSPLYSSSSIPAGYRPRSRRAQQDQAPHGAQVGQRVPEAARQGEKRKKAVSTEIVARKRIADRRSRPPPSSHSPTSTSLRGEKKTRNSSTSSSRAALTPSSMPSSSAASTCRRPTAPRSRCPSSPSS